jgi:hypothetical protein
MADQQEILNTILLTRLNYFSLAGMLELYRKVGSATLILEHKNNLRDILHLCGINDKGPGEREIMEENENKALALLEGASILKK